MLYTLGCRNGSCHKSTRLGVWHSWTNHMTFSTKVAMEMYIIVLQPFFYCPTNKKHPRHVDISLCWAIWNLVTSWFQEMSITFHWCEKYGQHSCYGNHWPFLLCWLNPWPAHLVWYISLVAMITDIRHQLCVIFWRPIKGIRWADHRDQHIGPFIPRVCPMCPSSATCWSLKWQAHFE